MLPFLLIIISLLFQLIIYALVIFLAVALAFVIVHYINLASPKRQYSTPAYDIPSLTYDLSKHHRRPSPELQGSIYWLKKPTKDPKLSSTPSTINKRRIVVSRECDKAMQDIVDELTNYYIFSWYRPLIREEEYSRKCLNHLREVLRNDSWTLISSFIDRLYAVNYLPFFTSTLIKRLLKHFQTLHFSTHHSSFNDSYDLLSSSSSSSSNFQSTSGSGKSPKRSSLEETTHILAETVKNLTPKLISTSGSGHPAAIFAFPSIPSQSSSTSGPVQNARFALQRFLGDASEESSLIYKYSAYLLEILYKESAPLSKFCDHSAFLTSLLSDISGYLLSRTIDLVSDPLFINLQLLKIIRKCQLSSGKELTLPVENFPSISRDSLPENPSELDSALNRIKSHTVTQLQKSLHEHNFTRMWDIIDHCEEIDSLRAIRLLIVGEILNAAVVEHLSRSKERRSRKLPKTIEFPGSENPTKSQSNKLSLLRLFSLNPGVSGTGSESGTVSFDTLHPQAFQRSKVASFKLNVPDSKVKVLQSKDLRRLSNTLRSAKTICEQKINNCKRQSAQQIPNQIQNRRLSSSSSFEASRTFEDSFSFFELPMNNSDLIKTFGSPDARFDTSDANPGSGFKLNKKKIFQFKTVMSNELCREWLKKFVANSLFSQDVMRTSMNRFKIDSLLSDCCSYLIEVWEHCERIFDKCHAFYTAETPTSGLEFNTLIADCYSLTLAIVCDKRFVYTFSDRFLQLPVEILAQIERFLLGQLSVPMIDPLPEYYNPDSFLVTNNFDPELIGKTPGITNRIRLDFDPLWKVFFELERIIGHCLQEEIYPQFLISGEYDQMLAELEGFRGSRIQNLELNRCWNSEKWNAFKSTSTSGSSSDFWNLAEPKRRGSEREENPGPRGRRIRRSKVSKIVIDNEMIDLTKNRNILLNILEFGLGTFVYLKALCEARLQFKIFVKHLLSAQGFFSTEYSCSIITEIANILKADTLSYHSLYGEIHRLIGHQFGWLHSDFECRADGFKIVQIFPEMNKTGSRETGWRSNTFLSSFVGNILGGKDSSPSESDLHFTLQVTSKMSPKLRLGEEALRELISGSRSWSVACSLETLHKWLHGNFAPNLRMLTFLSRFNLLDYLSVFTTRTGSGLVDAEKPPVAVWNAISRQLFQHETSLQRYFKSQIKRLEVRAKNAGKLSDHRVSFKNLLHGDGNNNIDISTISTTTTGPTSGCSRVETDLESVDNCRMVVEKMLQNLTDNQFIVRMNAFLSLVKFDNHRPRLGSACESPKSCFRCELYSLLLDDSLPDVRGGLLLSLYNLLGDGIKNPRFELFEDPSQNPGVQSQSSQYGGTMSEISSITDEETKTEILSSIALTAFVGTGRIFAMPSNSPHLSTSGGEVELFLLHARSLLSEPNHPAKQIIDYLLGNVRFFTADDSFCRDCRSKMATNHHIQAGGKDTGSGTSKPVPIPQHFRLFRQGTAGTGIDVVNSVDLNGNFELFDLLAGSGDQDLEQEKDEEENAEVVEPLYQLLIEVFQLKGTVAKTFRRTLMLAFRLLFGSTMVSKHFRLSLQAVFADKNILSWLTDILGTLKVWNSEWEASQSGDSEECQLFQSFGSPGTSSGTLPVEKDNAEEEEKLKRLQILTKQLLFTSVPSFASALFGQENLNSGLNKCFDIVQYRLLNKQLCYEFLEAFTLEYFPDNMKKA